MLDAVSFSSIAASLCSTSAFNLAALSLSAVMSSWVHFSSGMRLQGSKFIFEFGSTCNLGVINNYDLRVSLEQF